MYLLIQILAHLDIILMMVTLFHFIALHYFLATSATRNAHATSSPASVAASKHLHDATATSSPTATFAIDSHAQIGWILEQKY